MAGWQAGRILEITSPTKLPGVEGKKALTSTGVKISSKTKFGNTWDNKLMACVGSVLLLQLITRGTWLHIDT